MESRLNKITPILSSLVIVLISISPGKAGTELNLTDAIQKALDYSYTIKAKKHDSLKADSDFKTARSLRLPTLSLSAVSYYLDETQSIDFPVQGIPEMEIGTKENYQADLKLSMPLYTGGKLSGNIDVSEAMLDGSSYNLKSERLVTAYNCRSAYLKFMLSNIMISSAEVSLQRVKIIYDDIHNLHKSGLADSVDLLETELARQQAYLAVDRQKTTGTLASMILADIIGSDLGGDISTVEKIPPPNTSKYLNQHELTLNRPELRILDSRIRAADKYRQIEAAGYFPDLSIYGGYSYGKPNRDQFNSSWNDYFTIGLSLNWSFNFGGKTGHSVNSARQALLSAQMDKDNLNDKFLLQAEMALENINHAIRAMNIYEQEFQIAQNKYRLAENKHSAGQLSVNRLLELEKELTSAEQAYKASIINYYLSENDYLYSTGSDRIFGGL